MQSDQFKAAVGKYPTGVCVISTKYNNKLYGFTANSFASVSLDPALISFCLNKKAGSFSAFLNSPYFVVNILADNQSQVAKRFSSSVANKFQDLDYKENDFGITIISGALSFIECEKYNQIECGDHYIFVGKALKATINNDINNKSPLVYYGKTYMELK